MKRENWELLNSFCKAIKLKISEGEKLGLESKYIKSILETLISADRSTLKILQSILDRETKDADKEKLQKVWDIINIDTVGWASPKVLIDTLKREVFDK